MPNENLLSYGIFHKHLKVNPEADQPKKYLFSAADFSNSSKIGKETKASSAVWMGCERKWMFVRGQSM